MEVQRHGIEFENYKIKQLTNLSKIEYEKLLPNKYISSYDLVDGIIVNYNASIKTTKTGRIDCGSILTRMKEYDYKLIIGIYNQVNEYKIFHTEYIFNITKENYNVLWGDLNYGEVEKFVKFIQQIPSGKEGQQRTKKERTYLKSLLECRNSLMKINPKVDSKIQRRVQCSISLKDLLKSGITYEVNSIDFKIQSNPRK